MAINSVFYNRRLELNLSVAELSDITGLTKRRIRQIEKGFYYPTQKEIEIFLGALSLTEEDLPKNSDYYRDEINDYIEDPKNIKEKKPSKFMMYFEKLMKAKFLPLTLILLAITPIALIINYGVSVAPSNCFSNDKFQTPVVQIYQRIDHEEEIDEQVYDVATIEGETENLIYSNNIYFPQIDAATRYAEYIFNFRSGEATYMLGFSYKTYYEGSITLVVSHPEFGELMDIYTYYSNTDFTSYSINNILGGFSDIDQAIFDNINTLFAEFMNREFDVDMTFYKYSQAMIIDVLRVADSQIYYLYLIFINAIVIALLLAVYLISIPYRHPVEEVEPEPSEKEPKPLPKEIKFAPFIKEGYLRIAAIILIFAVSLKVFIMVSYYLNIWNMFNIIGDNYTVITQVLDFIAPIATLLIFFLKVSSRKLSWTSPVMFLAVGLMFYGLESIWIHELSMADDAIFTLLALIFPKNFFFPLATYASISYFLNHYPAPYIKTHKKSYLIAFRMMLIIPLSYLITSIVITFFEADLQASMPLTASYLTNFFGNFTLPQVLFIAIFVISKKIIIFYQRRHLTDIDYEKYMHSNRYQYILNIITCAAIALMSILNFTISSNEMAARLGFTFGAGYCLLLLPFLFFYRLRQGKRNAIMDYSYVGAYGLSLVISYLLLFLALYIY